VRALEQRATGVRGAERAEHRTGDRDADRLAHRAAGRQHTGGDASAVGRRGA
jgi:hypothetical protein